MVVGAVDAGDEGLTVWWWEVSGGSSGFVFVRVWVGG